MTAAARRLPPAVWLITAVHVLLAVAYTVLLPTWRGPDEPHHVDLALRAADGQDHPAWDSAFISVAVNQTLGEVQFFEGSQHLEADAASPRADRVSFDGDLLDVGSPAPNQLAQHPPGYYVVLGAASEVAEAIIPGDEAFDATVGTMRLLNALLVAVASPAAYLIARRLGAHRGPAIAAAVIPLAIPQWAAIGGSVNNDNLQTAQLAVLAVLVTRIATGDRSWGTALLAGAVAGAGMWIKGFGLVGAPWVVVAYVVGAQRQWRPAVLRAAGATAIAAAIGSWWWLANLLDEGDLQPSLLLLPDAPPGFEPDGWWWLKRFVPWMARRFWGWFGWFDVKMPGPVVFGASLLLVVLVVLGVRAAKRPAVALALLLSFAFLLAAAAQLAWDGYVSSGTTPGMQGRYLFPSVPVLAALAALGLQRLLAARDRVAPIVVWGAATAMQLVALAVLVPWYWGERGASPTDRLQALGAWSPWPGLVTAMMLLAAAVGWVLLGMSLVGDVRRAPVLAAPRSARPEDEPAAP